MTRILAIDPGPEQSGVVLWDGTVVEAGMFRNTILRERMLERSFGSPDLVAIEMIACYGMAVGKETFETCLWIGRFVERAPAPVELIYRKDVKLHLCQSMRAKDPNVRQALLDKHGKVGTAKHKGPLYGISGHMWAAMAVADYAQEIIRQKYEEKA